MRSKYPEIAQGAAQERALDFMSTSLELREDEILAARSTPNPDVFLFLVGSPHNIYRRVMMKVDIGHWSVDYAHKVPSEWLEGSKEVPLVPLPGRTL